VTEGLLIGRRGGRESQFLWTEDRYEKKTGRQWKKLNRKEDYADKGRRRRNRFFHKLMSEKRKDLEGRSIPT